MHEIRGDIQGARMNKQWDKVESYAREMLDKDSKSIYAIQLVGESLEKQGQVEDALLYYERALKVDREERCEVGHTFFLKRLDILYHRASQYDKCLWVCEYYKERHPNSWDAWNRLRRAAKKTGNLALSAYAEERANEIKQHQEALKQAKEARHRRWKTLYNARLRELGFNPDETMAERLQRLAEMDEPAPSPDASNEEWGKWVQRTTDLERIDAEIQAAFDAFAQMSTEYNEDEQSAKSAS